MADSPPWLGPFRLTGLRSQTPAGEVHAAAGPAGAAGVAALLAADAATDAAARDRFADAVAAAQRRGQVLAADVTGPRPWVVLAPPADPAALLERVLPPGALVSPAAGPAFEPHWRHAPGGWAPPPAAVPAPPDRGPDRSGRWLAGGALAAVALVLAGVLGWSMLLGSGGLPDVLGAPQETEAPPVLPDATPTPAPTPVPPPTALPPEGDPDPQPTAPPAEPSPEGAPAPSGTAAPDAAPSRPLETSGPGVAGPSFTPEDETVELRLPGLPFAFRVPAGWECDRVEDVAPPGVRYACIDRSEPGDLAAARGVVEVQPCPAPCGELQWQVLRGRYAPAAPWRPVDARTAVAEGVPPTPPNGYVIRMSRLFAAQQAGPVDTHVYVELSGRAAQTDTLQKIVNDIRANTE